MEILYKESIPKIKYTSSSKNTLLAAISYKNSKQNLMSNQQNIAMRTINNFQKIMRT
jgi:hypothetical protein